MSDTCASHAQLNSFLNLGLAGRTKAKVFFLTRLGDDQHAPGWSGVEVVFFSVGGGWGSYRDINGEWGLFAKGRWR